jgi:Ca2+/Na+ antiporter
MSEDVAGATFMAAAVSCPELFINVVGTFITEGDIGVGTIVGSAVFNVLAVPACCGLFAKQVIFLIFSQLTFTLMFKFVHNGHFHHIATFVLLTAVLFHCKRF